MAAKKKKAKKKATAKRAKRAPHVQAPRPVAAPAELKELDSEWKRFIEKTIPDEPLTEVWEAPKGTPSSKSAIRAATLEKPSRKKAVEKTPARKKAPTRRKPPARKKSPAKRKTPARKAPARRKTPARRKAKKK